MPTLALPDPVTLLRRGLALLLALGALFVVQSAQAQTITPITWNIIGLDSNNVSVGPNKFPIGARICNTTGTAIAASTRQAKYNWVTTHPNIARTSPELLPIPALAAGACQDIFHEVTITRSPSSYGAKAQYNIEVVDAAGSPLGTPVRTPANREVFVERLISQGRNQIEGYSYNGGSLLGPGSAIQVAVGQTFDLELRGATATQGYEQLEKFIELNPAIFRVNRVTSTYSANAGTDPNAGARVYADGCGWVNDITNVNYRTNLSCTGVGKYGGKVTQKYNITVLSNGGQSSVTAGALIYDFSGSSFHYNADFSSGGITFQFAPTPPTPTAADVSMVKTATFNNSTQYTFNLTVANLGPADATGVVVTDTVPASCYTIDNQQGAGWAGTVTGDTVTWNVGNLALGASQTLPIKVNRRVNGTGCTNTACATSTSTDPNSANNCSDAIANQVVSDLVVTKTISKPLPVPGESVTFTIAVTNQGTNAAPNVVVTDAVPNGYTVTGATPSAGTFTAPNWTIPTLAVGATATLSIAATVNASGTYLNSATASSDAYDPDLSNNTATAAVQPTYLGIAKSTTDTFSPGSTGKTFTVTVSKVGNANLGTITVTDVVPFGFTPTGIAGTGWSCTLATRTCTRTDDISATTGFPIAYPAITVTVSVAADAPTELTNFVFTTSSVGGSYAEAISKVTLASSPDMAISLSGLPTSAAVGVAYTGSFTCTNVGSATASAGTTCAVTGLPANLTVSGCTINTATPAPSWSAGSPVPVNAVVTCAVSGTPAAAGNATVNGTTGATGDTNAPNNTASVVIAVTVSVGQANLSVTKTGPTTVAPGGALTYTIVVANAGPSAANGSTLTDPAVANFTPTTLVCGSTTGGAVCPSSPTVGQLQSGLTIATFPSGGSLTFTVSGTAGTSGSIANTASIFPPADVNDPALGNNSSLVTTTITSNGANLSVTKTGPATVVSGGSLSYTIVVANAGPSAANGSTLTDAPVANFTATTLTCGSTSGGAVCPSSPTVPQLQSGLTIATLPNGGSLTFTLSGTAGASGSIANTASVFPPADINDPALANNTSLVTTAIISNSADLSVTKTGPASVAAGSTVTYTILVANAGPVAANGATVSDPAVANFSATTLTCGSTSGGAICPASPTVAQLQAGIAIPTLPNGGALTFTVSGTAGARGSINNSASVAPPSGVTDPTPGNNTSLVTTTINPPATGTADLSITKTGPALVQAGGPITYEIIVRNAGPNAADRAIVRDEAVPNFNATAVVCGGTAGGAVCPSLPTITQLQAGLAIPSLPANSSLFLIVRGTAVSAPVGAVGEVGAAPTTSIVNVASVAPPAGVTDPNVGNNVSIATTGVEGGPAGGTISGFVWYDTNGNRVKDNGEAGRANWRVQLLNQDFQAVATAVTGANGFYNFVGLPPGTYSVRFTPVGSVPGSGAVNGDPSGNGGVPSGTVLSGITLEQGATVINQSLPIDPSGVVYGSVNRQPIAGAEVTLLFNGAPANPVDIAGGSNVDTTAMDGQYAFFLLPGAPVGTWGLSVAPSAGYGGSPSSNIPPSAVPAGFPGGSVGTVGAPPSGANTTYYLSFPLPTIDIVNNNIPVDPLDAPAVMIPTLTPGWLALLALLLAAAAGVAGMVRRRAQ